MNYDEELELAKHATIEAGKLAMKYFNEGFKVETKKDKSFVTIADRECEKLIRKMISEKYPDDMIVGEEHEDEGESARKWIIDPVDGTEFFVRKEKKFFILISLEVDEEVVAGVVHMPALDIIAYASKGSGAFINKKRVHVSDVDKLENANVTFRYRERFEKEKKMGIIKSVSKIVKMKDIEHDNNYLDIASGNVDAVINPGGEEWDLAAFKIIIEEAGGKLSDFSGKDTIYSKNCVITNGKIHQQIIDAMNMSDGGCKK